MSGKTIDVSDFMEFAADCDRAVQRAPQVFANAAFSIGTQLQQKAALNAMPHRRTGSMETKITPAMVTVMSPAIRSEALI